MIFIFRFIFRHIKVFRLALKNIFIILNLGITCVIGTTRSERFITNATSLKIRLMDEGLYPVAFN